MLLQHTKELNWALPYSTKNKVTFFLGHCLHRYLLMPINLVSSSQLIEKLEILNLNRKKDLESVDSH